MVKSEYVFSYIFFSSILLNTEKNEDLGDAGSTEVRILSLSMMARNKSTLNDDMESKKF